MTYSKRITKIKKIEYKYNLKEKNTEMKII